MREKVLFDFTNGAPATEVDAEEKPFDPFVDEMEDALDGGLPPLEPAFVGHRERKKYHRPGCRYGSRILPANLVPFATRAEAAAAGYAPCGVCHPDRVGGAGKAYSEWAYPQAQGSAATQAHGSEAQTALGSATQRAQGSAVQAQGGATQAQDSVATQARQV